MLEQSASCSIVLVLLPFHHHVLRSTLQLRKMTEASSNLKAPVQSIDRLGTKSRLLDLPLELQLFIFEHLDYDDLKALECV